MNKSFPYSPAQEIVLANRMNSEPEYGQSIFSLKNMQTLRDSYYYYLALTIIILPANQNSRKIYHARK